MIATATSRQIAGIGFTSQRTRNRMMERLRSQGIANEDVLRVMATVPRHLFVDEAMATHAYDDRSLPIGEGQTISQPFAVARMTEILLEDGPLNRVLEVGTGSGFQSAVLSQLVNVVFTVERIRSLLDKARHRFKSLGYRNVNARYSDGSWGWSSQGPFDGIIVTAAPVSIPAPLLEQLAIGGRMVIPVGAQNNTQSLTVITRTHKGFAAHEESDVTFVPFLSGKS